MANKNFITKPVRIAFPNLTEPRNYQGQGKLMYSVNALVPKSDKGFKKLLEDYVQNEIASMDWKKTNKEIAIRQTLKNPDSDFLIFKDGDLKDLDKYPFFANHWVLNLKAYGENKEGVILPPRPVYNQKNELIPPALVNTEIYGGCWVRFSLSCFCFEKPKQGATLRIHQIQKYKDDDTFVQSAFDAVEDFEDVDDDNNTDSPFEG